MRRLPSITPSPCLLPRGLMLRRLAVCHPPGAGRHVFVGYSANTRREGCVNAMGETWHRGDFNRKSAAVYGGRRGPDDLANLCVWVARCYSRPRRPVLHTSWLSWVSIALVVLCTVCGTCAPKERLRPHEREQPFSRAMGPVTVWLPEPGSRVSQRCAPYKARGHHLGSGTGIMDLGGWGYPRVG